MTPTFTSKYIMTQHKKVLQRRNTSSTFTATLLERNNYYNNISVFIGITITLEVNRKSKPLMKFH